MISCPVAAGCRRLHAANGDPLGHFASKPRFVIDLLLALNLTSAQCVRANLWVKRRRRRWSTPHDLIFLCFVVGTALSSSSVLGGATSLPRSCGVTLHPISFGCCSVSPSLPLCGAAFSSSLLLRGVAFFLSLLVGGAAVPLLPQNNRQQSKRQQTTNHTQQRLKNTQQRTDNQQQAT